MADINFQPIFNYIDQAVIPIKEEIAELRADMRLVKTTVVNMAGDIKTLKEEMMGANYRIKRLEDWAGPVGRKVDIPIEF